MRAARSPSPASRAQDYKLGGPPEERRYTCPSYELIRVTRRRTGRPRRVDLPGFRPVEAYEAALANLAPALDAARRSRSRSTRCSRGRRFPLATAEIAAVCDREIPDVRAELARSRASSPSAATATGLAAIASRVRRPTA